MADLEVTGIRLETVGLEAGVRRSETALERLDRQSRRVTGDMRRTGDEATQMGRRMRGASRDVERADSALFGMGRTARRVLGALGITVGLAALALAMRRLVGFVFQTNVSFERLQAQLKTTEGSVIGAQRAFDAITKFAVETPFEVENLTAAFVRLRAFGLQLTTRDLRGIGNVASAFSQDITEVADAIISAVTTSTEPIRRFGFGVRTVGQNLEISFQGVERTIPRSINAVAAFVAEMGNTTRVSTAMSDQMKTMSGRLSNLADAISLAAKRAGEGGLNTEFSRLIELLTNAALHSDGLADALGTGLGGAIRIVTTLLQESAPILEFWGELIGRLGDQSVAQAQPVVSTLRSIADEVGEVRAELEQKLGRKLTPAEVEETGFGGIARINVLLRKSADQRDEAQQRLADVNDRIAAEEARLARNLSGAVSPSSEARALARGALGVAGRVLPFGGGAREAAQRAAQALREPIDVLRAEQAKLQEAIRRTDVEIEEGVRRRRQLTEQAPIIPPSVIGKDPDAGKKAKQEVDALAQALDDLTQQRAGLDALTDVLAGTSLAISPMEQLEERVQLLRRAIEDIVAARIEKGLDPFGEEVVQLTAEVDDLNRRLERMKSLAEEMESLAGAVRQGRFATAEAETAERLQAEFEAERQAAEQAANAIAGAFGTAFGQIASGTQAVAVAFQQMVQSILQSVAQLLTQRAIVEPLVDLLLGAFSSGSGGGGVEGVAGLGPPIRDRGLPSPRQLGGPVLANEPVVVGESGAEVFIPGGSGRIVPTGGLMGVGAGVGESHVHFHNSFEFRQIDNRSSRDWAEQQAPMLARVMARQMKLMGVGPRGF